MATNKIYDETEVFMKEIFPLMEQVHALCEKHDLPIVMYCQYGQEDDPDAPDDRTRAAMSAMVGTPGERAAPMMHALALAMTDPSKAILSMVAALAGQVRVVDAATEEAARGKAKDAADALLKHFAKPGHA